jgi:hypothetical protein
MRAMDENNETILYRHVLPAWALSQAQRQAEGFEMTHEMSPAEKFTVRKGDRPVNWQLRCNTLIKKICTKCFENKEVVKNSAKQGQRRLQRGDIELRLQEGPENLPSLL